MRGDEGGADRRTLGDFRALDGALKTSAITFGALEREFTRAWTIDQMCRMAHMSRSSFLRSFRRALGQAPVEFLIERRLDAARRMLRATDRPVTEVALD